MKNKGFTLIELLAVILILGIIALIAIPTVSRVVEQSKKGAAEQSARQYINSIETLALMSDLNGLKLADGIFSVDELNEMNLTIKGTIPSSGYVVIEDGNVVNASLLFDGFTYNMLDEETSLSKVVSAKVTDNDKSKSVSIGDSVNIGGEIFYIYKVESDKVNVISKYNLNVGFNYTYNGNLEIPSEYTWGSDNFSYSSEYYAYISNKADMTAIPYKSAEFNRQSENSTAWKRGPGGGVILSGSYYFYNLETMVHSYWTDDSGNLLSKYNTNGGSYPVDVYDSNSKIYKIAENYNALIESLLGIKTEVRLLTYNEILELGCTSTTCKNSSYPWIYNTSFWLGSAATAGNVMHIGSDKVVSASYYANTTGAGIRPVIIIPKSVLELN